MRLPSSVVSWTFLLGPLLAFSLAKGAGVRYSLITNETASWGEAGSRCAEYGGRLAVIDNGTHWDAAMRELVSEVSWIGMRYDRLTTTWVWHTGSALTFTNVKPKPLTPYWQNLFDAGVELCGTAYGLSLPWEPQNCSRVMYFLCQDVPRRETSSGGEGGESGSRYYWVEDPHYSSSDSQTIMEGMLKGLGFCMGLILAACLLIQLPCCRNWDSKKNILFARRQSEEKPQEEVKA